MFPMPYSDRRLVRTLSAFHPSQGSIFTQRTIHTKERKWKVIPAHSSDGGALSTQVSKMVTRMVRHYNQDKRQSDGSLHWDTMRSVLLKAIAKHEARDFSDKYWLYFIHQGSSKVRIECCEDSKKSLAYFRAIQGHSGGTPLDPELMGYIRIPYNLNEFFFHRGCSFSIQFILENGLIPRGKESNKGRQTIFFTPLNPFGGSSEEEEEPRIDFTVPQKKSVLTQSLGTKSRCRVLGKNYPEHKIRDCSSGRRSQMQSSYTVLCQQIATSKLFLKKRSNTVRKTLNPTTSAKSHSEKQLAIPAAATAAGLVQGDLYGRACLG